MLSAMARPSRLLVPRPSSSIITRLCLSIFLSKHQSLDTFGTDLKDNVPQNESHFSHLDRKGGNVSFDAVVHRNSRKKLMDDWKRGIRSRYKATNLSHHSHKSNGTNVCAFTAHVATSDDLKAGLSGSVNVIGNKLLIVNLVSRKLVSTPYSS